MSDSPNFEVWKEHTDVLAKETSLKARLLCKGCKTGFEHPMVCVETRDVLDKWFSACQSLNNCRNCVMKQRCDEIVNFMHLKRIRLIEDEKKPWTKHIPTTKRK